MAVKVLNNVDVSYLDGRLLDADGQVKMVGFAELADVPHDHVVVWCVRHGVYQIPTSELIEHLRQRIAGREALEICAGHAPLGKFLGCRSTDNYMQLWPEIKAYYDALGQAPAAPPDYVERIDALEAVKKYQPQVVVGAFVTHRWKPGLRTGNQYGPEEGEILALVEEYVHVGNIEVHREKPLRVVAHEETHYPWLVSRAFNPEQNRVMVWKKQKARVRVGKPVAVGDISVT